MVFNLYFTYYSILQTVLIIILTSRTVHPNDFDPSTCKLRQETKDEIRTYLPIVEQLRKAIKENFQHKTYDDLKEFIDVTGPRLSGSKGVERAINFLTSKLREQNTGVKSIQKEAVDVPKPTIGTEGAVMILPRKKKLPIIPERFGKNTPPEGIVSKVIVVHSLDELRNRWLEVFEKIVVFNFVGEEFSIRPLYEEGIREGDKMGAAAILLRCLVPFSSRYTLAETSYTKEPPLPVATLTIADTELLDKIAGRGQEIVIRMFILGYKIQRGTSYNVISDYEGTKFNDQYVVISGHLDNVKVGLGVQDDGIGLLLSLNTIRLLNSIKLRPRYTIRTIFWTSEEYNLVGAKKFAKSHAKELSAGRYRVAIEADEGCEGLPRLLTKGSLEFYCILNEILVSLLKYKSGETGVVISEIKSTDVAVFSDFGVPIIDFAEPINGSYFSIRHTKGDTMAAVRPNDLDTCLLVYATTAFVLSDLNAIP